MTHPLRSTGHYPASALQRNRLSAAARFRRGGNDLRAFHSLWVGKAGGELLRSSPPLAGASVLSASRFEPLAPCMGLFLSKSFGTPPVGDGKEVSLGEKLARYATSLRYEDLPEEVIRIAKGTILDTLGCAFGGYSAGPSKIAMKLASDINSKQPGTILLSGIKTSPELAVFANGVMIRYLDFNDAYVSQMNGSGHPSDTIAAVLTAGELRQRSGRDLITATVLAYEVYCKIGDVFDYLGHGIDHTTVTGMGAVVGAGKLVGLTPEEMVHAIGITVGGNTATRQGRADTLSNWKAYAAADACRKAIFSLQLAQNGMTGPSAVFEGRYGFFKVMSRQPVQ